MSKRFILEMHFSNWYLNPDSCPVSPFGCGNRQPCLRGGEGCIRGGRHARSVTEGSARGVRNETALLSLSVGDQKTTGNESDLNQLHIGITQSFTTSTQANRDSLLISL